MDFKTGQEGATGASKFQKAQGKSGTFLGGGYLGPGEARPDCGQEEQHSYQKGWFPPQCISRTSIMAKRNGLG